MQNVIKAVVFGRVLATFCPFNKQLERHLRHPLGNHPQAGEHTHNLQCRVDVYRLTGLGAHAGAKFSQDRLGGS